MMSFLILKRVRTFSPECKGTTGNANSTSLVEVWTLKGLKSRSRTFFPTLQPVPLPGCDSFGHR